MEKGAKNSKQSASPASSAEPGQFDASAGPKLPETNGDDPVNPTGAASIEDTSDQSMQDPEIFQTSCIHCNTVFEVPQELMASSNTRVRCGECLSIFDAAENLRELGSVFPELNSEPNAEPSAATAELLNRAGDNSQAQGAGPSDNPTPESAQALEEWAQASDHEPADHLDDTYANDSDFDLYSGEARLPEVPYYDQTQNIDGLRFGEPDGDETYIEALDMTVDAGALNDTPPGVEPVAARAAAEHQVDGSENEATQGALNVEHRDSSAGSAKETTQASAQASAQVATPDVTQGATPGASSDPAEGLTKATASGPVVMQAEPPIENPVGNSVENPIETRRADEEYVPEKPLLTGVAGESGMRTDTGLSWWKRALFRLRAMQHKVAISALLGFIVLATAGWFFASRYEEAFLQNPDRRPLLVSICSLLKCQLPPFVDLSALKPLKRSMFTHPTLDNSLLIDFAFKNEARFAQPYPSLEVTMSDRSGKVVAQTRFSPRDYLQQWAEDDLMASDKRVDLSLSVDDPGQSATSFIVTFR